jgi:hypothetical protein
MADSRLVQDEGEGDMKYWLTATLTAAAVLACSSLTGPPQVAVGIIEWVEAQAAAPAGLEMGMLEPKSTEHGLPALEAPDTVTAGQPFTILARTYGLNSCWREAGAEVVTMPSAIEVTPYDKLAYPDAACLEAIVRLDRTIELTFAEPGQGVIRVTGRRMIVGEDMVEEEAQLEHTIVVLPASGS